MTTAQLFNTGGSQAVRLPEDFRFEGEEVFIRRDGRAVILEPKSRRRWPKNFFASIRITDPDFVRPVQDSFSKLRCV